MLEHRIENVGFIRDCFTGEDSSPPRKAEARDDGFMIVGNVIVVGGITFVMTVIHPALGAIVLVGGIVLGAILSKIDA